MPQRKSAKKALRQIKKRRLHNLRIKRDLKKTIKQYLSLIQKKDTTQAKMLLSRVYSKLDKAVKKNIIKKNTAARKKSRLTRQLHAKNPQQDK
ncbi:MAG: 30S ribosomal protein S20 [Candidatus Omnitrophica bacterium]|nr:30S ribosomal protein S20 [Candidatus Omnitrophota bacterium]